MTKATSKESGKDDGAVKSLAQSVLETIKSQNSAKVYADNRKRKHEKQLKRRAKREEREDNVQKKQKYPSRILRNSHRQPQNIPWKQFSILNGKWTTIVPRILPLTTLFPVQS
jgi:hypothetical protein